MYNPDLGNNRIREVAAAGGAITAASVITTFAGNGTPGYMGDGAAANEAELWGPSGVAVDAAGNVPHPTCNSRVRNRASREAKPRNRRTVPLLLPNCRHSEGSNSGNICQSSSPAMRKDYPSLSKESIFILALMGVSPRSWPLPVGDQALNPAGKLVFYPTHGTFALWHRAGGIGRAGFRLPEQWTLR